MPSYLQPCMRTVLYTDSWLKVIANIYFKNNNYVLISGFTPMFKLSTLEQLNEILVSPTCVGLTLP